MPRLRYVNVPAIDVLWTYVLNSDAAGRVKTWLPVAMSKSRQKQFF